MDKKALKEKLIETVRVIAFVIAFIIIVNALSTHMFSGNIAAVSNKQTANAYSFCEEPNNSIDVIALGNSDLMCGFVPATLWETQGITSCVAANNNQSIQQAQRILKDCMKMQKPKLVIMEIDSLYDGRGPEDVNSGKFGVFSTVFKDLAPKVMQSYVENAFPIFFYHNLWKKDADNNFRHKYSHGYYYNNTVYKLDQVNYMDKTDMRDYPINSNITALTELKNYCDENGLQLMLLELPSLSSWSYARHNAVEEIAGEIGVELLDLNLKYENIGISMTDSFRDEGNHLSHNAAVKISNYIANYIVHKYGLKDNRNDKYIAQFWNKSVECFYEYYKIEK